MKFPVFDARGEPTGVGTVVTDVTEQKKIEAQLAQAQRIESLGQLTGGIAHDFNNLLTSILLNADVLASVLDDKLRPLAEAVRMAAERGADLTRRLLAFGRRQMLEPRPTDLRELLTGDGSADAPHARRAHPRSNSAMPPTCGSRPSIRASSRTRCSTSRSMRATRCRTAGG